MEVQRRLPTPPRAVFTDFGRALQESTLRETTEMLEDLAKKDDRREIVFKSIRSILQNNANILFLIRTGTPTEVLQPMIEENVGILTSVLPSDPEDREGRLSFACTMFVEIRLLRYFFSHGCLAVKERVQPCTDEEYLQGALGFAHELVRYALGQASEGNTESIELCKKLLIELNTKMMEFDFRNGPLRRKYDGLKYALKKVEEITYELSLLDSLNDDPALKRMRLDSSQEALNEAPLVDCDDMDAIRSRYEEVDKTREEVIKQSRDVQKPAAGAARS